MPVKVEATGYIFSVYSCFVLKILLVPFTMMFKISTYHLFYSVTHGFYNLFEMNLFLFSASLMSECFQVKVQILFTVKYHSYELLVAFWDI